VLAAEDDEIHRNFFYDQLAGRTHRPYRALAEEGVFIPNDEHAVVQRIEEQNTPRFASKHKELRRRVLSVVHRKGDRGASNQSLTTTFPASCDPILYISIVATVMNVMASHCMLACITKSKTRFSRRG
jgi:hypothetical protein